MKSGIGGAFVGLIIGLVVGAALFGPLGGAVGVILGTVSGFLIVTALAVSFVREATKKPFFVSCPETHQEEQVTLDPSQAGQAELWNQKQRIATCTRFQGSPTCDEDCLAQLGI